VSSRIPLTQPQRVAEMSRRVRFNPLDAGFREDPYPLYERLRDEAPYLRTLGMLVLTRHADVQAALRDRRLSVGLIPATIACGVARLKLDCAQQIEQFIRNSIVFTDSPEHLRLRRLINQAYTPAAITQLKTIVAGEVDTLVERALDAGNVDAISEIAAPLPLNVLCAWMGVPAEARKWVAAHVGAIRALLDPGMLSRAHYEEAIAATAQLTRFFVGHANRATDLHDGSTLIARLCAARSDGDHLSETEVAFACIMSFVAGNETTQCLIGNTLDMLLHFPAEAARLRVQPGLIGAVVEESIRYQTPLQFTKRVASQALEINGHAIARGEQILLCLGAANRDSRVFDSPERVSLERSHGAHLGFGRGMHACLGGALARLQTEACISALFERTASIERLTDATRWQTHSLILRGLETLPLRLVRRTGAGVRPNGAAVRNAPCTLVELAQHWAAKQPEKRAFVFLGEGNREVETLSFAALDAAARRVAADLLGAAPPGSRALLMFPSGLSFIVTFFACHYAGLVPVPLAPGHGRRMQDTVLAIALDSRPALLLTTPAALELAAARFAAEPALHSVRCMSVDFVDATRPDVTRANAAPFIPRDADGLALIQYTSGSTFAPKGVCVTQVNLFANLEMQRIAMGHTYGSTFVGWAPLHHDMGLIANVLEPFYLGGLSVLMSPAQFAQSPWLWLRAISDYRARVSGGPNFAFALCVARMRRILDEPLDLSCWQLAFNSAEPVRAETLRDFATAFAPLGFRAEALYPCYGMAEATLLVSGGAPHALPVIAAFDKLSLELGYAREPRRGEVARELVGCGQALHGERLAIVDPHTARRLPDGAIGEIWVHGPHIPHAYWNQPVASTVTLCARIAGEPDKLPYLRTGDLGFMRDGELFITGRLKDVLILRGRNIYPQDVERRGEQAFAGLRQNASAAFLIDEEHVVLVQEIERSVRRSIDAQAAIRAIRRAVLQEFEFTLRDVVLVEPGSILKTSSGKIRRAEIRTRFLAGRIERIAVADGAVAPANPPGAADGVGLSVQGAA
jgi:Acyl-CoA synthetases (AMP-forming)/AMP-acid ligases II